MRCTSLLITSFSLLFFATVVSAQEDQGDKGQILEVTLLKVAPSDATAFEATVADVVKAAKMANLDGKFGWGLYSDFYTYAFVSAHEKMADFDNPEAWMQAYAGTEGEAMLQDAFGRFEKLNVTPVNSLIQEDVPSWTHWPSDFESYAGATVYEVTVKAGQDEAFNKLAGEFASMWAKMGYPYPIVGHKTRFGGPGNQYDFVVLWDSKSSFYGDKSIMAVAERSGNGEAYGMLISKLRSMLVDMNTRDWTYMPNHSYSVPEGEMAGSED